MSRPSACRRFYKITETRGARESPTNAATIVFGRHLRAQFPGRRRPCLDLRLAALAALAMQALFARTQSEEDSIPELPAPAILRSSHAAPDQKKGKVAAWSVHGGDRFAAIYASPKVERRKLGQQKRKVSFLEAEALADVAIVSTTLRPPSVFRRFDPSIVPAEATAEATWLVHFEGDEMQCGFTLDGETNEVVSIDDHDAQATDGDRPCRRGSLRVGDRILTVNSQRVQAGPSAVQGLMLGLNRPGTRRLFVHFDVARVGAPAARLTPDGNGMKKASSVGARLSSLADSFGAGSLSMPRSPSYGDLAKVAPTMDSNVGPQGHGGGSDEPLRVQLLLHAAVPCEAALTLEFDEGNHLVSLTQARIDGISGLFEANGGLLLPEAPTPSEGSETSQRTASAASSLPDGATGGEDGEASSAAGSSIHGGDPNEADLAIVLQDGDELVSVNGTTLRPGDTAHGLLTRLDAENRARPGGLSQHLERAFIFTLRRVLDDASMEQVASRPRRSTLRTLKYRAWRELDVRRTTLVRGSNSHAHSRAQELANDVLASQMGSISIRHAGVLRRDLAPGTGKAAGLYNGQSLPIVV